jgi:hypothetical protein
MNLCTRHANEWFADPDNGSANIRAKSDKKRKTEETRNAA